MSDETPTSERVMTSSADYSASYYATHLGSSEDYSWDTDSWREFFIKVAERIVAVTGARSVLDVGCAKGLLVQALVAQGVDAVGFDISRHAIETAHEDIRDRLFVASATDPIKGRFDLITSVEVLEHMSDAETQLAIDRMCAATDRIVFSSTPGDYAEPTHINVNPGSRWAAWFADRGFYRRTDVDLSFLTPWAVLFERTELSTRDLVLRYEAQLLPLAAEVQEKRGALLQIHREVTKLKEDVGAGDSLRVKQWEREVLDARHQLLIMRDHVIGTEAEVGRLRRDLAVTQADLRKAKRRLKLVSERREDLREKLAAARERQQATQKRAADLRRRLDEQARQNGPRPSLARRVARRLRGNR